MPPQDRDLLRRLDPRSSGDSCGSRSRVSGSVGGSHRGGSPSLLGLRDVVLQMAGDVKGGAGGVPESGAGSVGTGNSNTNNNTHRIAVKGITSNDATAAAAAAAASGLVLARAYNAALDALTTFRVAHLKLAHDFISKPARGMGIARGEDGSGNRLGRGGNAAVGQRERRACPFSDARSSPAASAGGGSSSSCPFMQTRTAAAESPPQGRGGAEGGEGDKEGDGKGEREEKVTEASRRGATGTGGSPFEAYLSKHIKATRRSKVRCSRVY